MVFSYVSFRIPIKGKPKNSASNISIPTLKKRRSKEKRSFNDKPSKYTIEQCSH